MTNESKLKGLEVYEAELLSWISERGYDGKVYAWVRNTITAWKKMAYKCGDDRVYARVILALSGIKKFYSNIDGEMNAYDPIATMYFVSVQLGCKFDKSILKTALMLMYLTPEEWNEMDKHEIDLADSSLANTVFDDIYRHKAHESVAVGLMCLMADEYASS